VTNRYPNAFSQRRLFPEHFNRAARPAIGALDPRGRLADLREKEFRHMMRRTILALAPALLAPLLLSGAAVAQPGPPHGPHGAPSAEMKAHHEAMRRQHMEDLKTVLRLRPDQEPALAAFMAAHEPKTFERRLPDPGSQTTPQRLDEMAKVEAEMAGRHKAMRDALTKFYAALSPEQQKVFDALHRLKDGPGDRIRIHHGPGGRMGMMGHGPMGGPGVVMMRRHGGPDGPDE
jgi:periplasmic protein CpxP/Spy